MTMSAAVCCLLFSRQAVAQVTYISEISSAEQLAELATQVNDGEDYSGRTVTLAADIDLSDYTNWTPIGIVAYDHSFNGTFDGKGHKITNLKVDAKATETGFVAGLFGVVGTGGTVKDVTVVTTEVRIDKIEMQDDEPVVIGPDIACYVGAITGINYGCIVGCANRGVSVYGNWDEARVGGIAGENGGSIQNCYNLGEVYTGEYYNNILGGIVGQNSIDGTIQNCFVRATIDVGGKATYGPLCANNLGAISGCFYMNGSSTDAIANLVINDNADNVLSDVNGQKKNVLLDGRTIYSDAAWNTLCLPFDISSSNNGRSPIAGASVKELDAATSGYNASTGVLTLNFKDATAITAGKPYIVRWDDAIADDLSNPVFLDVTINSSEPVTVTSSDGKVSFLGIYSPLVIPAKDKSLLYLGQNNTLYNPSAAMTIRSCRAYFQLNGIEVGDMASAGVRAFNLNFNGGQTTGIRFLSTDSKDIGDVWFTLSGVSLNGKPTVRGVYINNGRKVVIK